MQGSISQSGNRVPRNPNYASDWTLLGLLGNIICSLQYTKNRTKKNEILELSTPKGLQMNITLHKLFGTQNSMYWNTSFWSLIIY